MDKIINVMSLTTQEPLIPETILCNSQHKLKIHEVQIEPSNTQAIDFNPETMELSVLSIDELQYIFFQEQLNILPEKIIINHIEYSRCSDHVNNFSEIFNDNKRAYVVYKLINSSENRSRFEQDFRSADDPTSIQNCLMLMWHCIDLTIHPERVMYENGARLVMSMTKSDNHYEEFLGQYEDIVLIGFNDNEPIKAKVDTGATTCSLHAENIIMSNDIVQFDYNKRSYKMIIIEKVKVNSPDGGTEVRPVVKFDLVLNGCTLNDVEFNLNNRGHMDTDALIGANLITQGDFKIDL